MAKKKKAAQVAKKSKKSKQTLSELNKSNSHVAPFMLKTRTLEKVVMEDAWFDEDFGFLWISTARKCFRISCSDSDIVYNLANSAIWMADELVAAAPKLATDA